MTNDAGRKPEGAPERSPKAGVGGLSERSSEEPIEWALNCCGGPGFGTAGCGEATAVGDR